MFSSGSQRLGPFFGFYFSIHFVDLRGSRRLPRK